MAKFGKGDLARDAKPLNLIATVKQAVHDRDKATGKQLENIKGYFITVQMDQSLMKPESIKNGQKPIVTAKTDLQGKSAMGMAQTNPYLNSTRRMIPASIAKDHQDHPYTSHRVYYSANQVKQMFDAAENVPDGKKPRIANMTNGYVGASCGIKAKVWIKHRDVPVKDANGKEVPNTFRKVSVPLVATKHMYPSSNYQFGENTLKRQEAVTQAAIDVEKAEYAKNKQAEVGKSKQAQAQPKQADSVQTTQAQTQATQPAVQATQPVATAQATEPATPKISTLADLQKPAIDKAPTPAPAPAPDKSLQEQANTAPKGDLAKAAADKENNNKAVEDTSQLLDSDDLQF